MNPWKAILLSVGMLCVCAMIPAPVGTYFAWLMVLGTSLWAAIDSSKIHLKRYKSGISTTPTLLFFACALLWIVGFPWYLVVRHKIKTGTAILKEEAPVAAPN
jgi:hypothetical protein